MKILKAFLKTGLIVSLLTMPQNNALGYTVHQKDDSPYDAYIKMEENTKGFQDVQLDESVIYFSNHTIYVRAKNTFSSLNKISIWNQQKKQLIVGGQVTYEIGNKRVKVNNEFITLKNEPILYNDNVYVPLYSLADLFGYHVIYEKGSIRIQGEEKIGTKGSYEEIITRKKVTISAAGDFTLGYYKGQASGGRFDEVAKKNGYDYFMKDVKKIFEEDDLTIANLEGPLTTRGVAAQKQFAIRGLPEYTAILKAGDIEVVNLANNHTLDYQQVGYNDTIASLKKSDIGYFGEDNTYYTKVNDVSIALIGANGWDNSKSVKEKLKKRIQEAKKKAELIIVEFHWGIEREHYPNGVQKDLAKYVIDQGAHLVLGSHPHVIQGIGSYKERHIVYSMGNFCFGANKNPDDKDTFIYQETFSVTEFGVQSEEQKIIPCRISSSNSRNDYQPTVLEGAAKEAVLKRLDTYSKNLKE